MTRKRLSPATKLALEIKKIAAEIQQEMQAMRCTTIKQAMDRMKRESLKHPA